MSFDPKVPDSLKRIQTWFGGVIEQPMQEGSRINPKAPSGHSIEREAAEVIMPSPTLRPFERVQIYNQQYWWRLLSSLHEDFPLVTRLFGYQEFNEKIAIPYLVKYPPHHFSLTYLGEFLPKWVAEDYQAEDKAIILDAIKIDWAFNAGFFAAHKPPLTGDTFHECATLQPHIYLFSLPYDLFAFRGEFLKQNPDYWMDHDFPILAKERTFNFILYRDRNYRVVPQKVDPLEFKFLQLLREGATLRSLIEWLESQDKSLYNKGADNLPLWMQGWIKKEWLTLSHED